MERNLGLLLVLGGIALSVIGLLVWSGALSWLGRLPGDLRFGTERTRVYVPLASMIVLSVVLTLAVNLIGRWWR